MNKENLKYDRGFDKNPQNINRKGRPKKVSLRNAVQEILNKDGKVKYEGKQVVDAGMSESGEYYAVLKLPKEEHLALRFVGIAMSKNESNALRALQHLEYSFDGKPDQRIEIDNNSNEPQYDYSILTDEELETLMKMLDKCEIKK